MLACGSIAGKKACRQDSTYLWQWELESKLAHIVEDQEVESSAETW